MITISYADRHGNERQVFVDQTLDEVTGVDDACEAAIMLSANGNVARVFDAWGALLATYHNGRIVAVRPPERCPRCASTEHDECEGAPAVTHTDC